MKKLITIFFIGCLGCGEQQNQVATQAIDSIFSDTVKYSTGEIQKIFHKKNNVIEGTYIHFWPNGDTLIKGNYSSGKRNGEWDFSFNPLSTFNDTLLPIKSIPVDVRDKDANCKLILLFKNDSIISVSQKVYRPNNSKIKFLFEYKFNKDTIQQMTYWTSEGIKVSIERALLTGIPHDTSFYLREDGTLDHISIIDHGILIKKNYYDSTGKKIIREK
jgi:hypothetical protein